MAAPLLRVRDLSVRYPVKAKNRLSTKVAYLHAVEGVSLEIDHNETLGIVGESGCGKSTLGKAIVGLVKPAEGTIELNGTDCSELSARDRARQIQIIFQDPYSSLDPRLTVGASIEEPLSVIEKMPRAERRARAIELMREVGLREDQYDRYPYEFSGGQRQRVGIARALATNPSLVVCDEPVSALDVSIQAQILNLVNELKERHNLAFLFISHNLSVVEHISDKVGVMYLGHIVEYGTTEQIFEDPQHPYTQALFDAIPLVDVDQEDTFGGLHGDVPSAMNPPSGCCFHTRCPYATEACAQSVPVLEDRGQGHMCACHLKSLQVK